MSHNCKYCIIILSVFILLSGCDDSSGGSSDSVIVCFGDSLTAGFGSGTDPGYPEWFAYKVTAEVVNHGVSGDTTEDGLLRINSVLNENPVITIVEFGANDFFTHTDSNPDIPLATTIANIDQIVDLLLNDNIIVFLAKFYRDDIVDDFAAIYGNDVYDYVNYIDPQIDLIAAQDNVYLIEDIWGIVWDNQPYMYYDDVHPNSAGYAIMADQIYSAMETVLTGLSLTR
jgi:acyl-CoA thioesterase I